MSFLVALVSWVALAGPVSGVPAVNEQSPQAALGERMHQAMSRQGQLLEIPEAAVWCQSLLSPAMAAGVEVYFTNDDRPRAFALPGGRIYLSAGAFLALENSDQLAFVLAHEAAHVHLGERSDQRGKEGEIENELQADQKAVEQLKQLGRNPGASWRALSRLASTGELLSGAPPADGLNRRLAALPRSSGPLAVASMDPSVAPLQVMALSSVLARAVAPEERQFVQRCLEGACALVIDESTRQRLQAETWRRNGRFQEAADRFGTLLQTRPATPELHRGLALSLEALGDGAGAAAHWRWLMDAGAPDARVMIESVRHDGSNGQPPTPRDGQDHRFDGFSIELDRPWRRVASTHRTLRLSRDGPGIQWLGLRAVEPPDETNPGLALDRWLTGIRSRMLGQQLILVSASLAAQTIHRDGLTAVLEYRDAAGLRWRLGFYRVSVGGRTVEVEFKAPRLHYFERDLPAVVAALGTLRDLDETGQEGSPISGHNPEPLLQP